MRCTACSGQLTARQDLGPQMQSCVECGGLHGTLTRGAAASLVGLGRPMLRGEGLELKYFDLTVLGGEGAVSRTHGFFCGAARRVVQYG